MASVINIAKDIDPLCMSREGGQILYRVLKSRLASEDKVVLDFKGVEIFVSPYFNNSVGLLLREMTEDELRKRVLFENVIEEGVDVIETVIMNSAEFYSMSPEQRREIKKIVRENLD